MTEEDVSEDQCDCEYFSEAARAVIPIVQEAARQQENEACARIAEKHNESQVWAMTGAKIANVIRARLNQKD